MLLNRFKFFVILLFGANVWLFSNGPYNFTPFGIQVERMSGNPMLVHEMYSSERSESSIMSGCLIKVPTWVSNPLGKYYLYSAAHHARDHLDLAYADDINGPWTVYDPGVLPIEETCDHGELNHISAPDVHVLEDQKRFVMFFHGDTECFGHQGGIALSDDGITWRSAGYDIRIPAYFVVKRAIDGKYYGVGKKNEIFRSDSLITSRGSSKYSDKYGVIYQIPEDPIEGMMYPRHSGLRLVEDTMYVLYTNKRDTLEHVKVVRIVNFTDPDTTHWIVSEGQSLLRPEYEWEGAELPTTGSPLPGLKNQLRDPKVYTIDNQDYLCYSLGEENGIGIARIFFPGVDYGSVSSYNPGVLPILSTSGRRYFDRTLFSLRGRALQAPYVDGAVSMKMMVKVNDAHGAKLEASCSSGRKRK